MYERLNKCLQNLSQGRRVPLADWPDAFDPAEFDLAHENGVLRFAHPPDVLQVQEIRTHFPDMRVEVFPAIDSTNTYLIEGGKSCAGRLCSAEIQLGGRGRRGRQWFSPFARNLAISMGFATVHDMSELGGLSMVAGLALVDVLQSLGIQGVGLKWPNDVLIAEAKVCGILVELVTVSGATEVVVGFGVNVALDSRDIAQIDQSVTDLRRHGVTLDRTQLLILFAKSVRKHIAHFDQHGFSRFKRAFDAVHTLQGQQCRILMGDHEIYGEVVGVADDGGIQVRSDGQVHVYHGGEISLRRG